MGLGQKPMQGIVDVEAQKKMLYIREARQSTKEKSAIAAMIVQVR